MPALGLAQHHGLKTCLLDFTWNPYTAVYFAAREFLEGDGSKGRLCVWVINDTKLTLTHRSDKHHVRLMVPPASDNRTLQAQDGLFLYSPLELPEIQQLDQMYSPSDPLERKLASSDPEKDVAIKITLEAKHAREVMRKLIKLGYGSARLFPTYEGAVKSVFDYDWAKIGGLFG